VVRTLVGDIFRSTAQTLVNTVNCVGVMGKGIALEFRKRFPAMYDDYVRRCANGGVELGKPYLFRGPELPWVLLFPTKQHWRSVSRLDDIVRGLRYLEAHVQEWGITSLAVPPLGCGLGQLEWRVVGPTLHRGLQRLAIPVELYAPYGTPAGQLTLEFLSRETLVGPDDPDAVAPSSIEPGMIALVEVLERLQHEPYHWPVGRTTFQKLAYFGTQLGLPTGLTFVRGSYGPHAPELKARLAQLVNNGIMREERLGRMFHARVGSTFHDARREQAAFVRENEDVIERLHDLFARMNTRTAEIAATVHFVAEELKDRTGERPSEMEVLSAVMEWKQRRRPPMDREEVATWIRSMASIGWLEVSASADLPVPADAVDRL